MKSISNRLILILVLLSLFAPGLLVPKIGLATLRADCSTNPGDNPDNDNDNDDDDDDDDGDPVSMATGAFQFSVTDLKLPGIMPILFTRNYDSTVGYDGPIGYGWDLSFNRHLTYENGVLHYHKGRVYNVSLYYAASGGNGSGGTVLTPWGAGSTPGGTLIGPGGTVLTQGGTMLGSHGTVLGSGGALNLPGGEAIASNGGLIGADGTVLGPGAPVLGGSGGKVMGPGGMLLGNPFAQSIGRHLYMATYDSSASTTSVTDAHGNQDTFDANGHLIESMDRNGNELTYTRDSNGNLLSVQDPVHGQSMTFTLDPTTHRITAVTDSSGRTVTFTYDSNCNLISVTYPPTSDFPSGITVQYSYDSDHRMISKTDGNGNTFLTNTYGTIGSADEFKVVSQTFRGQTATFAYNDAANETTLLC